jgi:hypothetical protein
MMTKESMLGFEKRPFGMERSNNKEAVEYMMIFASDNRLERVDLTAPKNCTISLHLWQPTRNRHQQQLQKTFVHCATTCSNTPLEFWVGALTALSTAATKTKTTNKLEAATITIRTKAVTA